MQKPGCEECLWLHTWLHPRQPGMCAGEVEESGYEQQKSSASAACCFAEGWGRRKSEACDSILFYSILFYSILFYAMPCHAMPCHAMPCHAMPCHAMPCHAFHSIHSIFFSFFIQKMALRCSEGSIVLLLTAPQQQLLQLPQQCSVCMEEEWAATQNFPIHPPCPPRRHSKTDARERNTAPVQTASFSADLPCCFFPPK